MSGFRINTSRHIDGMIGVALMGPYFFWLVPKLLNADDVPVDTMYTVILTSFALVVNAMAMSWFTIVKKVPEVEYRVSLLLLAGGITIGTFVFGMWAGDIILAVLGSVLATYIAIYWRSSVIIRGMKS